MKKLLLGTTALVAGGFIAGAASAADIIPAPIPEPMDEGFSLVISGTAKAIYSFKNTDECGVSFASDTGANLDAAMLALGFSAADRAQFNNTADYTNGECVGSTDADNQDAQGFGVHDDLTSHIFWDSKIVFDAETTLANGLGFAAHIELNGQEGGIEDHWIDITGHFGMVSIGVVDGANKQMTVTDVGSWGVGGGPDDPNAEIFLEQLTSQGDISGSEGDMKIVYITPRFSGLQLAVSYSPDTDLGTGARQSDGQNHVVDSDSDYINTWSFGANHQWSYGSHEIEVGGGFGAAQAETSLDTLAECLAANTASGGTIAGAFAAVTGGYQCGDLQWFGIGAVVSNDYASVGAHYSEQDSDFGAKQTHWNAGVIFERGDWSYGGGYAEEENQHAYYSQVDELQEISVGVSNNIASGVELGGFANFGTASHAWRKSQGLSDLDAYAVGTGVRLKF